MKNQNTKESESENYQIENIEQPLVNEVTSKEEEFSIDEVTDNLVKEMFETNDRDKLRILYNEFKVSSAKKEISLKQSFQNLLSRVAEEAIIRVEGGGSELSDKALIDYANMAGNQAERLNRSIETEMSSLDNLFDSPIISNDPALNSLNGDTRAEVIDILYALIYGVPNSSIKDEVYVQEEEDLYNKYTEADVSKAEEVTEELNDEIDNDKDFYSEEYEGDD